MFKGAAWSLAKLVAASGVFCLVVEGLILADYLICDSMMTNIKRLAQLFNGTTNIEMNTVRAIIAELEFMHNSSTKVWNTEVSTTFVNFVGDLYALDKRIESMYTFDVCPTREMCNKISTIVRGNLCQYFSKDIPLDQCVTLAHGCALNV